MRTKGLTMLKDGRVATRLPAQDLQRARAFYAEKLGLEPSEERPGGLLYRCASGVFALFKSAGASPGTFTQMSWEVDDLAVTVAELRRHGVVFEEVDVPGLKTVDGIADVAGNYPSRGSGGGPRGFATAKAKCLASGSRLRGSDRTQGRPHRLDAGGDVLVAKGRR